MRMCSQFTNMFWLFIYQHYNLLHYQEITVVLFLPVVVTLLLGSLIPRGERIVWCSSLAVECFTVLQRRGCKTHINQRNLRLHCQNSAYSSATIQLFKHHNISAHILPSLCELLLFSSSYHFLLYWCEWENCFRPNRLPKCFASVLLCPCFSINPCWLQSSQPGEWIRQESDNWLPSWGRSFISVELPGLIGAGERNTVESWRRRRFWYAVCVVCVHGEWGHVLKIINSGFCLFQKVKIYKTQPIVQMFTQHEKQTAALQGTQGQCDFNLMQSKIILNRL